MIDYTKRTPARIDYVKRAAATRRTDDLAAFIAAGSTQPRSLRLQAGQAVNLSELARTRRA